MSGKTALTHIAIAMFVLLVLPISAASAGEESAWRLVQVVDYPNDGVFSKASEHPAYDYKASYAPGSFTITQTYVGKGDPDRRPPMVHGESLTIQAQSSVPPATITRGQTVSLTLAIAATENSLSFFTFSGSVKAYFDSDQITPGGITSRAIRLENGDKQSHFSVKADTGYATITETVSATPRSGSKPGDRMALMVMSEGGGNSMGTKYVYEWGVLSEQAAQPQKPVTPSPSPAATTPVPETDPKLQPCDARFGDLTGEVNVKLYGEDDDAYIFAELSTPLYHNSHIRTRPRSGAIISYTDMTTFVMKEDTQIVLDCAWQRESKTRLVAGKVWANLKRLVGDGTLEIEMSQAVAGIKGTTLILEDDGTRSTIKVLEGTVTFTSRSGQVLTVSDGEMAFASNGNDVKLEQFDIAEEMSGWDVRTRDMTVEILSSLTPAQAETKNLSVLSLLIALVVLLGGGSLAFLLIQRKNRLWKTSS